MVFGIRIFKARSVCTAKGGGANATEGFYAIFMFFSLEFAHAKMEDATALLGEPVLSFM
jgi:hypothetical protein